MKNKTFKQGSVLVEVSKDMVELYKDDILITYITVDWTTTPIDDILPQLKYKLQKGYQTRRAINCLRIISYHGFENGLKKILIED